MKSKIAFWKHHPIADQTAEALAKETIEWQKKFNFDMVKITPAGSWQATCYGVVDSWENDFLGRRNITGRIIQESNDWNKIRLFDEIPSPLKEQLGAAKLVCDEIKDVPVYATVFCPITQAIQMAGIEQFKKSIQDNPELVQQALSIISKNTLFTIKQFHQNGVKGLYYVTQAQQEAMMSFETYSEFGKHWDTECLELAVSLFDDVIFHLHGDQIYACIEPFKSVRIHFENNETSLEQTQSTNFEKLIGILASEILSVKSDKEIARLIRENKSTGNLITCGCVIPLDFSEETLLNWVRVCKKQTK